MIDAEFELYAETTVARLLDERTTGDERVCTACLGPVGRKSYFDGDFYCPTCVESAESYPWASTTGGMAP